MELSTILNENDFTLVLETVTNPGSALNRAEIEAVIVENSLPLPTNDVSFFISDPVRKWLVHYGATANRYFFTQLNEAT